MLDIDTLRLEQMSYYANLDQQRLSQIDDLKTQINKKDKTIRYWQVGGTAVSIGLLLFLLLK